MHLILLLLLLGGAIAYVGNRIGRAIGRRRYTLWGLRPKHSSVLITIATGVAIAAASLGVLTLASSDVRSALFEMSEIKAALDESRAAVAEAVGARDEAIARRDLALSERDQLQAEVEAARAALAEAAAELEASRAHLAALRDLSETLEDSVRKMHASEELLRAEIATLTEQYMAMERALRAGEFLFRKDEVVAARVLRGNPDAAQIEGLLHQLLEEASHVARSRGVERPGSDRVIELGNEDSLRQAVDLLTQDAGDWVVRVTAAQNTVAEEPLLVYLHLYPRRQIYRRGEVILEQVLSGGREPERALMELLDEVNDDALQKGMITAEDGSVGHLAGEAFVDALLALRRINGPARVRVTAAADTWNTEGPLGVAVEVTRV